MLPPVMDQLQEPDRDPNRCLAQIEWFVDHLLCEPLTVGRVFGSDTLDAVCQQIGHRNLVVLGIADPPDMAEDIAVYIVSKLQASGGHTAALLDVIRLSPKRRSIVLVTGVCGKTDRFAVQARLRAVPELEWVDVPPGTHLEKLSWIQRYLQTLAPSEVWLWNHHQDSVAVAAVQPDRGYALHFYHHADDRLCLGVCLGYGSHLDITPVQFHRCRNAVGVKNNRYLPLVAADLGIQPSPRTGNATDLVTCTAAGFNKVEVGYSVQYIDIVPKLLRHTGGRHVHIGRLTPWARWRLRRALRQQGVPLEAFVYIPYVPSVWQVLHDYQVDLYIASFPYGGGKTMVEVMGAGVPIVIHQHIADRMIGGFDMVYDGAFTWREPKTLYAILDQCNRDLLHDHRIWARAWYEKYHSDPVMAAILADPNAQIEAPPMKPGFVPDPVMEAWVISQEVAITPVVKRQLWRLYRRIKSVLGRM